MGGVGRRRLHGLKSGKMLREFRGHSSFVNAACFLSDQTYVASGSSDGTVRVSCALRGSAALGVPLAAERACAWSAHRLGLTQIWNTKTAEQIACFDRFGGGDTPAGLTVNDVFPLPQRSDEFVVCTRSPTLVLLNQGGQVVKSFSNNVKAKGDFVACCISPRGDFLYGLAEDRKLYCFRMETGELEHSFEVLCRPPAPC
jgi:WD40 repeat-containing protein SMU1